MYSKTTSFLALAIAVASSANAELLVPNGDFEDLTDFVQADPGTSAVVTGWYTVTDGAFWQNTWHDTREGPTAGFTGATAAFSGDGGGDSYLYQSIGTDAAATSLRLGFDWGDFGDHGFDNRNLGLTVAVYEFDGIGSFLAGNNVDVLGGEGVTLINSVSVELLTSGGESGKLSLDERVTLDLASQTGGELFLRFHNYNPAGEGLDPWLMLDNVYIVPEPSTYALIFGALALAGVMVRRRFRKD